VDAGVEVTDSTDRSLVGFSRGSVVKLPLLELAEAVVSDASAETVSLAVPEAEAVALAEVGSLMERVTVCHGTSDSVEVLEAS
jgi:hypothetical protein